MNSERCKNCGTDKDEHYDGAQCPLQYGTYSSVSSFKVSPSEVEWRVSPQVFQDIYDIIAKHGMGLPDLDEDMRQALFGDRLIGPDAAAMEIVEKYGLRVGIPLTVIVDYKMDGYGKPKYEGEENESSEQIH